MRRRMLSSLASNLARELGCRSRPEPATRPWPAQLELPRARQAELVICDYAIERTLAWLNRNRRLAKDFEALIETATAWLFLASVKLLSRRLARG